MKSRILGYCVLPLIIAAIGAGCTTTQIPQTAAAKQSGFTYIPIDPFAVSVSGWPVGGATNGSLANISQQILQALPDNAARLATEQFGTDNQVTYGPANITAKGGTFKITMDYMNSDTVNVGMYIERTVMIRDTNGSTFPQDVYLNDPYPTNAVPNSETFKAIRLPESGPRYASGVITNAAALWGMTGVTGKGVVINLPIYVGVGLRVTATVTTVGGGVTLTGLGSLTASNLSGTLVVQTLGINGKSVSAALPVNSDLNQPTVQNAIVAVGQIKEILYDKDTVISPRVLGMYLPFRVTRPLVNSIISELSKSPVPWNPESPVTWNLNRSAPSAEGPSPAGAEFLAGSK